MRASVESRAQPRDAHVERAAAVDRAGEHLVAGALLDRQRLAGHRRLVDVALARRDAAVERDLLARPHDDDVADARRRRPARAQAAGVASRDERFGRRQIHQRADRAARALHRARLEQLREREQEHDRRGFAPLAEDHRAGDGDHHQHVDVERRATATARSARRTRVDAAASDRDARRPRRRDGDDAGELEHACPAPTSDAGDDRPADACVAARRARAGAARRARATRACRSAPRLRRWRGRRAWRRRT